MQLHLPSCCCTGFWQCNFLYSGMMLQGRVLVTAWCSWARMHLYLARDVARAWLQHLFTPWCLLFLLQPIWRNWLLLAWSVGVKVQILCPECASYLSRRDIVTTIGMQLMDSDNNWYATLRNIAKDLLRTLMIKSLIEYFYSALQIILLLFLIQFGCCWRLQKFTISCIANADKHWTNHAMITQQSPLTHLQRPYIYTGKSVGHNTGIRFGFTASWKPKRSKLVCFRLLAMMLLQSVNSGRQDRRKSPERAQQARSLARLFALKAAFLLHCLFFIRGRGHR